MSRKEELLDVLTVNHSRHAGGVSITVRQSPPRADRMHGHLRMGVRVVHVGKRSRTSWCIHALHCFDVVLLCDFPVALLH